MHSPTLRTLFFLFIISPLSAFAQNRIDTLDAAVLSAKPYHTESTTFTENKFVHDITFNEPHSVDEENYMLFEFTFTSTDNIQPGQIIDLAKDTGIVHCKYGILSAWIWDYDSRSVFSGTIKVVSKTKKEIVIEENVRIIDNEGRLVIYKGTKTFRRHKKKKK